MCLVLLQTNPPKEEVLPVPSEFNPQSTNSFSHSASPAVSSIAAGEGPSLRARHHSVESPQAHQVKPSNVAQTSNIPQYGDILESSTNLRNTSSQLLHNTSRQLLHNTSRQLLHNTSRQLLHNTSSHLLHSTSSNLLHNTSSHSLHNTSSNLLHNTSSHSLHNRSSHSLHNRSSHSLHNMSSHSFPNTALDGQYNNTEEHCHVNGFHSLAPSITSSSTPKSPGKSYSTASSVPPADVFRFDELVEIQARNMDEEIQKGNVPPIGFTPKPDAGGSSIMVDAVTSSKVSANEALQEKLAKLNEQK